MGKNHYVYVIAEWGNETAKIGVSKNPWSRVDELQTGNPRALNLMRAWAFEDRDDAFLIERTAHEMGSRKMVKEWHIGHYSEAIELVEQALMYQQIDHEVCDVK